MNSIPNISSQIAIATVTDTRFLKGTLILLHSFLKQNQWFYGDIIIIEDDLTAIEKEYFSIFPNIKFQGIHSSLNERINILGHFWKRAKEVPKRFYSQ